jgi:hypothetical protein
MMKMEKIFVLLTRQLLTNLKFSRESATADRLTRMNAKQALGNRPQAIGRDISARNLNDCSQNQPQDPSASPLRGEASG